MHVAARTLYTLGAGRRFYNSLARKPIKHPMDEDHRHGEDAITKDEITGTAVPPEREATPTKRNAFSELMSPKSRYPATTSRPRKPSITLFPGRDGLGAYVQHPESFPPSRVIYHTDDFVAINDLYPKSSVHTLLLPRDRSKNLLHAFDAFEDTEFLASVQAEVKKLRQMVATELRRKYGRFSDQEKAREEAMGAYPPPDELPSGRDWEKDVISGIHSRPSMNHLHIHVLSVDRFSECMKHRKHYNSFATPFLVAVEDFPLAKDDVRRHPGREGYLNSDLKCWRCGENFGHKFASLKQHLAEEFEQWKKV